MSKSSIRADSGSRGPARVLIVEDSFLAAMHLESILREMQLSVAGPVASVEEGVALATTEDLDAAILDVSIRGGNCRPVAEVLRARGCPFLLATGYDSPAYVKDEWQDVPILHKPIDDQLLERELLAILSIEKRR